MQAVRQYCPDALLAVRVAHAGRIVELLDAGADLAVTRQVPPPDVADQLCQGLSRGTVGPDEVAVELAACTDGLCHSTSWRREGTDVLVLTYAALPDGRPDAPAEPLPGPLLVTGGDALNPAPAEVRSANVAAHELSPRTWCATASTACVS
jgi:hypothetical protein